MNIEETKAPYENIINDELKYSLYNFSTLVSLLKNKKITFQTIFILFLTDEKYRNLLKTVANEDDNYTLCNLILEQDSSIATSKQIMKIVRNSGDILSGNN